MRLSVALLLLPLLIPTGSRAGDRAGNGFAVLCMRDEAIGLRGGYYSLDYLVTLGMGPSRQVESWEDSAERIRKLLAGVVTRKQLDLYEDFVANVRNESDYSKKRVWEAAPFGVVNLKTQPPPGTGAEPLHKEQQKSNLHSLVTRLPESCLSESGDVELIPAVVFQSHGFTGRPEGYLVYKFVPRVLDELEVNDPLQLSYLYIHEWLWDISNSEDRNRRLSHLLHSERADGMSASELRKQMAGMGLAVSAESLPSGSVGAFPPEPGYLSLENGRHRLVVDFPLPGKAFDGRINRYTTLRRPVPVRIPGKLLDLRAYVVYEAGLESAGFFYERLHEKGGQMSDVRAAQPRCNLKGFPPGSCVVELLPVVTRGTEANADYQIRFELDPKVPTRIHAMRVLFESQN